MEKIKEVIIVEGRDDIRRVSEVVQADFIETHGMGLNDKIMSIIEEAYRKRGIIIFTDPDHAGETIRKAITQRCPNAKHAFIRRNEGIPKKQGSLGVEHASREAILEALQSVATVDESAELQIDETILRQYGLLGGQGSKQKRQQLGEKLRIGYTNGKQLKKRLATFQITKERLDQAMKEIMEETDDRL